MPTDWSSSTVHPSLACCQTNPWDRTCTSAVCSCKWIFFGSWLVRTSCTASWMDSWVRCSSATGCCQPSFETCWLSFWRGSALCWLERVLVMQLFSFVFLVWLKQHLCSKSTFHCYRFQRSWLALSCSECPVFFVCMALVLVHAFFGLVEFLFT